MTRPAATSSLGSSSTDTENPRLIKVFSALAAVSLMTRGTVTVSPPVPGSGSSPLASWLAITISNTMAATASATTATMNAPPPDRRGGGPTTT